MGFLQQEPESTLLMDDHLAVMDCNPEIPEDAYPPVIEGNNHPLMIIDDFALDLFGADSPAGYTGLWVIREGLLYLRWLLGSTQVRWDLKADWYTGDLIVHQNKNDPRGSLIHISQGRVWAEAA